MDFDEHPRDRFIGEPYKPPIVKPLDSPQKIVGVRSLRRQVIETRFTRRLQWTDANPNSRS